MSKYSHSEEDYIKAIYKLQTMGSEITTTDLSKELAAKPSSITSMIKKLSAKNLIVYRPYYGCQLTKQGMTVAINIVRKHRLWEYFLSNKLGFDWSEVHDVAEELEHIKSDKLIELLDKYLDYPKFDPHGDPIPDKNGKIAKSSSITNLSDVAVGETIVVKKISKQTPNILNTLNSKNIAVGTTLIVQNVNDYDKSVEIKMNRRKVFISREIAENIIVEN